MESNIREFRFFRKELARIHKELKRLAGLRPHRAKSAALRIIPGVGSATARSFFLEVFNPGRFRRPEEIASYQDLAPTVRQSGPGKARERIIPTGRKRLRWILIKAAWTWKQYDPQGQGDLQSPPGRVRGGPEGHPRRGPETGHHHVATGP